MGTPRYKLYRLIAVLESEELAEVAKFLDSPFHNTDKEVARFFKELSKFHPGMDQPRLTNEHLFARTFGKAPYDDQKMRRLRMKLKSLLERYLVIRELDGPANLGSSILAQALGQRKDYGLFREAVSSRMDELEALPARGKSYHLEMAALWRALYYHPETDKLLPSNDFLQRHIDHLESYFTIATLQNGTECLLKQRIINLKEQPFYLEAAEKMALAGHQKPQPIIQLFLEIFQLFRPQDQTVELASLQQLLEDCFNQLDQEEQRIALKMMVNYAAPFSNEGNREHTLFMFGIIQKTVDNDLVRNGHANISADQFLNITITAALVGKFEWASCFMDSHQSLLPEKEQPDALALAKASLHYQKGIYLQDTHELKAALHQLGLVSIRSGEKYSLRVRSLQLRIHYELYMSGEEGFDNVPELAKYFERHLANNPNYAEKKRAAYLQFVNQVKVLFKIASEPNARQQMADQYLKELQSDKKPILHHWLFQKAGELALPPRHQ